MIRLIGFIILCCTGGLWGAYLLEGKKRQLTHIQDGIQLLRFLEWELENYPDQAQELPQKLNGQPQWKPYLGKGIDYLNQLQVPATFPRKERRQLKQCFDGLGYGGAAETVQNLEQTLHWMEALELDKRQKLGRDSRLYLPIGLCSGLAIAILLL